MTKLYYRLVKAGTYDIDQVPTKWRTEVQALIDAEEGANDAA